MHVQHIAPRKRVKVPDVVKELFSGEYDSRLAHKALQQREFLERKRDLLAVLAHHARGSVHFYRADLHQDRFGACRAAQHRVDASQELFERKRFNDVVVGALVEQVYFVLGLVAGGQDDYRGSDISLADRLGNGCAVDTGEHEVKQDKIVLVLVEEYPVASFL